jgi:hypothetical protein
MTASISRYLIVGIVVAVIVTRTASGENLDLGLLDRTLWCFQCRSLSLMRTLFLESMLDVRGKWWSGVASTASTTTSLSGFA